MSVRSCCLYLVSASHAQPVSVLPHVLQTRHVTLCPEHCLQSFSFIAACAGGCLGDIPAAAPKCESMNEWM